MAVKGCPSCIEAASGLSGGGMLERQDVKQYFEPKCSYFSAYLIQCPKCRVVWLYGYYEDFSNTAIEDEWGDRIWIKRPLTEFEVAVIYAHSSPKGLDIDTYGAD